jgi:serine/threonine-protein kinase
VRQGTRLGRYEILSALGRGGMGEVWRARDTRLDRDVAIKLLPEPLARDAQRLARLEREARLLASISHPHIAVLYDLERVDEATFLALELVEGETLAERLLRGPIPVKEALTLALQIAEALEAAHERGVIHRDLKPANIKITRDGKIKVLDFGLAKAFDVSALHNGPFGSPALTIAGTEHGAILGTAAYMAPEQARGESVDTRADVWAFGCVLFEMLTGEGAFGGETMSDVLASVLKVDPGWNRLPENLHPRIRHVLERCLVKRRRDRFAGISDARVEMERALLDPRGLFVAPVTDSTHPARRRSVRFAAIGIAAVLATAVAAGLSVWQLNPSPPPQVMHFVDELPLGPPPSMLGFPALDISRDGTQIAYIAGEGMQTQQLYVRALDEADARPIEGVQGLIGQPRFSPDGRWIAYFAPQALVRVPVEGGTPQLIKGDSQGVVRGFSWDDERLLYAVSAGIYEVAATGEEQPRLLIPADDDVYFASPQRLPGRDAVLFSRARGTSPSDWDDGDVVVQSLESGEEKVVARNARDARYLASGHILYAQGTALYAAAFDLDRLEVMGTPVRIREGIVRAERGESDAAQYAVSYTGSLVYLESAPGAVSRTVAKRSLVWVDRTGARQPVDLPAGDYSSARISPDGQRVVLVKGQTSAARPADLWIFDLETGNLRQLTSSGAADAPVWSRDSTTLYFRSTRSAQGSVQSIDADGGDIELVAPDSPEFPSIFPWALTTDGRTLLAVHVGTPADTLIVELDLGAERAFRPLLEKASLPALSPEPWIAYVDTSGPRAISISPYPDVSRQTYPVAAGSHPAFSRDGRELYFVDGDALRAVSIEYEPVFRIVGAPRDLFRGPYTFAVEGRAWDVHPDGQRFLMLLDAPEDVAARSSPDRQRIHHVLNWTEKLSRRLAAE